MKSLYLIVLLILFCATINAQNASTREWTIFRKGISEYQKGNYDLARQSFSLMLNKLPNSALTTINQLMLAKTNYKSGDYEISLRQCEEFTQNYPQSSYFDDAKFLIANNYYRLGRTETAVVTWLKAAFASNDVILRNKAFKLADNTMLYRMNSMSIDEISRQYQTSPLNEAFIYNLAETYYRDGKINLAKDPLAKIASIAKSDYYKSKAQNLLDRIEGKLSGELMIAALLPLSGNNEKVGKSLLAGFKLALQEHNNTSKIKISLTEFDYGSRLLDAIEQLKQISNDPSYLAVLGPVENDIVAACASIADYEGITVISPTASTDRIKNISQNYIGLAPSVKTMAQTVQFYVHDSLKINRIATFTPLDDYFMDMSEEFSKIHQNKGGTIVAQEWYYPGDQNYKKQFRKLKRLGLHIEFGDSLRLENPNIKDHQIDSLYTLYLKEQREILKENKTKLDSADIPVTAYEGIFMPVYEDDISFIASQFAYANFKTQLIGNSDWYNKDALKNNRNYVNGIIFVTDGYLNEESWDFRQFRNNFRNTFKTTPEKFDIIGYDCLKYIQQIFDDPIGVNRNNFLDKVIQLRPYQGIYRNFTIDNNRSNKSARLLKYIYGQIIPIH